MTEIELAVSDYQSHVQMMRSEVMDEVDRRMSGSRCRGAGGEGSE